MKIINIDPTTDEVWGDVRNQTTQNAWGEVVDHILTFDNRRWRMIRFTQTHLKNEYEKR